MPRSAFGSASFAAGVLPAVAFIVCFPAAASVAATASLSEGRDMAMGACSACHQVTPDQKPPSPPFDPVEAVNVAAPDFGAIAWKYANRPVALRRRILEPRHPMPEMDWDAQGLNNVIAYIRSARNIWRKPR